MSITAEEKVKAFAPELRRIYDKTVREFTRLCIIQAPDYFFLDCPASTSGKYHPIDELGADGTLIHTKKVFTVGYDLSRGLDCEENRDLVLSACIIHDLRKQGSTESINGHTHKKHPQFAAELVDEIQEATMMLTDEQHRIIRNCVGYHYGPWSVAPWKKPVAAYTAEELCVYMSDYIASKKTLTVSYKREENYV